jgi:peptidoglycan glycosyltransferase
MGAGVRPHLRSFSRFKAPLLCAKAEAAAASRLAHGDVEPGTLATVASVGFPSVEFAEGYATAGPAVNRQIVRLYGVFLLLFAALVGFTSYWSTFDSNTLKGETANRRPLIEEQEVKRGFIKTSDGVTVAESHPVGGGSHPVYTRSYPQGSLYGNPVGYSYVQVGQWGIEKSENAVLAGERNEFTSILDQLRGIPQQGDNVTLTIDSQAQQVATQALQSAIASTAGASGAGGAVVALDPSTGAVKAMASVPGYDPNKIKNTSYYHQLRKQSSGAPIVNRATQSVYPPGSTMKVVTAAAALDSGKFTPHTTLTANSPMNISGVPLFNDSDASYGSIDMTDALTQSVNTYFAQVGEQLGTSTMVEYMKRFGFYSDPKLDYPTDQMAPSGPYNSSHHLVTSGFDVGRVAIGQGGAEGQDLATPLQMAEVAATIANGGRLMQPTFVQQVTDPDGRVTQKLAPHLQSTVISPQTASELTTMMTNVTSDPQGTAASLSVTGNVPFAGKTGTAEIGDPAQGINQPWFIAFAPAQNPQVAVAATIERCQGCFGATVAGPIATQVMDSLLTGG